MIKFSFEFSRYAKAGDERAVQDAVLLDGVRSDDINHGDITPCLTTHG